MSVHRFAAEYGESSELEKARWKRIFLGESCSRDI